MYKQCRILNKSTNENYYGQIDTEFEGKTFYNLIEIPDDGKIYIWDRELKEKPINPLVIKKQALINYFDSFYPELKAFFKPAKDAVLEYFDKGDFETALRVIERYPLPIQSFINDEGNECSLENYRQEFINILRNNL